MRPWPDTWRRAGLTALAIAGVAACYVLTAPGNRSEAEDAYLYAAQVEQGEPGTLVHRHHLVYVPVMRALYLAAHAVGLPVRAYPLMCWVGAIAAALAMALFHGILRRMLGWREAGWAAGLLAVSYGFWRYAAEAEIYVPAVALGLATVALTLRREGRGVAAGLMGAMAIATHVMNALPALLAAPLLLAFRRDRDSRRRAAVQVAVTLVATALAYGAALPVMSRDRGGTMGASERAHPEEMPVKAMVGFGQSVVSGNFLFGFGSFRDAMTKVFPYREFREEFEMGLAAKPASRVAPWLTLGILALLGLAAMWRRDDASIPAWAAVRSDEAVRLRRLAGLWFVIHAAVALVFEPSNPEMWIMALPPFWMLASSWFVMRGRTDLLPLVACALAWHNQLGGMWLLGNPEGDYLARRTDWLVRELRADDTVLTTESEVFARRLRYVSGARVETLRGWSEGELVARYRELCLRPGRLFVLADVFDPAEALQPRMPGSYEAMAGLAAAIRLESGKVHDDRFGGVYERRIPAGDTP